MIQAPEGEKKPQFTTNDVKKTCSQKGDVGPLVSMMSPEKEHVTLVSSQSRAALNKEVARGGSSTLVRSDF